MNAVLISVVVMLGLSLMRLNVVVSLTLSALVGGLVAGMPVTDIVSHFESGLGNGAKVALSYAMLGAFAVAIGRSGLTDLITYKALSALHLDADPKNRTRFKYLLFVMIACMAVASQNVLPVHIAFIPLLIPPLVGVFNRLNMDRRAVACVLTFGLVTPYMLLPIGFGNIFLNDILLANLNRQGLGATPEMVMPAMLLPAAGMFVGLCLALLVSYRKPRQYEEGHKVDASDKIQIEPKKIVFSLVALVAAFSCQLFTGSMILGALAGLMIFGLTGLAPWQKNAEIMDDGVRMMAMIGFIMITAAGFAAVVKATGHVDSLVESLSLWFAGNQVVAALVMLVIGLVITMGIGSSFSTIPIIATLYVPLCMELGFSVPATIALIGTAAALGDAGSPASDSTLGPTSGLNVDGQHEHIWQTVVPTFMHFNLPLLLAGWLAAITL